MNLVNLRKLLAGLSAVDSSTAIHACLDPYTGAVQTIETEHLHIHAGRGFQCSGAIATIAASSGVDFYITPFSNQAMHLRNYQFSADGAPITLSFYENPTIAITGTQCSPVNRNRISSKVSSAGIFHTASATSLGTFLDSTRIEGTGTGANTTGETEGPAVEWILDSSKKYLIRAINNDSGSVRLNYRMFWYELGL